MLFREGSPRRGLENDRKATGPRPIMPPCISRPMPAKDNETEEEDAAVEEEGRTGNSGASMSQKNLQRPSAEEIYEQVSKNARKELDRSTLALFISGFGGGVFMGLSAMGTAIALTMLHDPAGSRTHTTEFIAKMFYPIGFIVVILGRSQLFTENTLYPVALVLAERRHLWNTVRLWATVLPANVLGALAFASLATLTNALAPEIVQTLAQLGLGRDPSRAFGDLLEWCHGWMDHRAGSVAGERIALDHRVGHGDLASDVRGWLGQLCPLHRGIG